MSRLKNILGAILRETVAAQHEADIYALKLTAVYDSQRQAVSLSSPAVRIGEMELTIHCAFSGEDLSGDVSSIDAAALDRLVNDIVTEIPPAIVKSMVSVSRADSKSGAAASGFVSKLSAGNNETDSGTASLGQWLYSRLKRNATRLVSPDGTPDRKRLLDSIVSSVNSWLLSRPELKASMMSGDGRQFLDSLDAEIETQIGKTLDSRLQGRLLVDRETYPSVNVTVSSEELSKLPDTSIQTIHLKLQPVDLLPEPDAQ